jgi:hypothetical protein
MASRGFFQSESDRGERQTKRVSVNLSWKN